MVFSLPRTKVQRNDKASYRLYVLQQPAYGQRKWKLGQPNCIIAWRSVSIVRDSSILILIQIYVCFKRPLMWFLWPCMFPSCLLFIVVQKETAAGRIRSHVDVAAAGNRWWPVISIRRRLKSVAPRHFITIRKLKTTNLFASSRHTPTIPN